LLIYEAIRRLSFSKAHYMMTDAEQLKTFGFFRKLGAYGVEKSSLGGIRETLHYTSTLLEQGGRVWLFPQGEIQSLHQEPLRFQTGIGHLFMRSPDVCVVPVTLEYRLMYHPKPDASMRFGTPILADWASLGRRAIVKLVESKLAEERSEHWRETVDARGLAPGYMPLDKHRLSLHEKFSALQGRG